jgi:uncharacterized protein
MTGMGLSRRRLMLGAGLGTVGAVAGAAVAAWRGRSGEDPAVAEAPTELRIATGPPGAVYRVIGGELVKLLTDRFPRSRIVEIQTDGTIDNLALLTDRRSELAFAHLDATGAGLVVGRPPDVTAVARLHDAWLQVIVMHDSKVRRFVDLHDRPVTAGGSGSGSRFVTRRLAEVAGIRLNLLDAVQADGATLLATGKVDAMMTLTGIPTPAVSRLATDHRLRMLPLEEYAAAMERRYGGFYAPAVLPASVYKDVEATEMLTTPNLLLSRPELPASVIQVVAHTLVAERARIARGHAGANSINIRTAIATAPVRLHPGAENYFRAAKP